eukprot:scaffold732_cov114-Cylindrotheca_fusiformis.AAC.1
MHTRNEEEYTDYSCSTPLEGLSRDVETILRTWHVDRGSDRHVTTFSGARKKRQKDESSSTLIRSNTLVWNFSVTDKMGGRSSVMMDLELCLWDAPGDDIVREEAEEEEYSTLVRSLRRSPFAAMSSHDFLFDNFSTLFGIGQHISLSPIQPEPMPDNLVEYLGNSLLQRHDDVQTIPWLLASTLSGWLQTSLNCAVSNVQCCIPAFGLWGEYRPNQSSPPHMQRKPSSSSVASATNSSFRKGHSSNLSVISESTDALLGTTILTTSLPKARTGVEVFPQWIQGIRHASLPTVGRKYKQRAQSFWNQKFVPPVITGTVVCPGSPLDQPSTAASMTISVVSSSQQSKIAHQSRLSVWASVLLEQCADPTVVLSGARHVFGWFKPRPDRTKLFRNYNDILLEQESQLWRQPSEISATSAGKANSEEDIYRQHCRAHALDVLDDAWGTKEKNVPMWGPVDDPVASVYITVTWNGKPDSNGKSMDSLLAFPLRIRSRRELSKRDYIEMEESMEQTALDPLAPTRFAVQAYFDRDTSVSTLAANQRCILAALVRAATLPGETLLQHLTEEDLVGMWDDNAGTMVANKLADRAKVGNATRQLVDVMEWSGLMNDMISVREAEGIVHSVMSNKLTSQFPDSPENAFTEKDGIFAPFRKSAPWGRLVSVLFAEMARLQALSSMAVVWGVFVDELRRRWEMRESLPNMQYVPGLDLHSNDLYEHRVFSSIAVKAELSAFLNCSEPDPDDYHCLIGQKLQVFNVGVECIVASELLENAAMENFLVTGEVPVTASYAGLRNETDLIPAEEKKPGTSVDDIELSISGKEWLTNGDSSREPEKPANYAPPAVNADLEFWVMDEPGHNAHLDEAFDYVHPASDYRAEDDHFGFVLSSDDKTSNSYSSGDSSSSLESKQEEKPRARRNSKVRSRQSSQATDDASIGSTAQFFDAAEAGSIFSMKNEFLDLDGGVNVAETRRRPGARCPVHGMLIEESRDQLFAPYFQRPCPLTDDVVLERKVMLSDRGETNQKKKQSALQSRLDVAQRLQKPKLLSDMCAFKAANPGCSIDDFTRWYGNPDDPLKDYLENDTEKVPNMKKLLKQSSATMLDKASEAMRVLSSTREFWSKTWESATPIPAAEQDPLFDYAMTVEMVLDFLGQMHPASLVNQVMAVNLSSAYFTIVSAAEESYKVGLVRAALQKLRTKTEKALDGLSQDALGESIHHHHDNGGARATSSVSHTTTSTTSNRFISIDAIRACEEACDSLSIAETMVARATSLLHKFPGQYSLVQELLRLSDGAQVPLTNPDGRKSILQVIQQQQMSHKAFGASKNGAQPVLREYVFRNLDDGNPSQLSVRYGDQSAYLDRVKKEGGVLLALLKSYKD